VGGSVTDDSKLEGTHEEPTLEELQGTLDHHVGAYELLVAEIRVLESFSPSEHSEADMRALHAAAEYFQRNADWFRGYIWREKCDRQLRKYLGPDPNDPLT
jgi:hypothetical protein